MSNSINYNKDKCVSKREVLNALLKLTDDELSEDFVICTNYIGGDATTDKGYVIYPLSNVSNDELYDSVWLYITDILNESFYGALGC